MTACKPSQDESQNFILLTSLKREKVIVYLLKKKVGDSLSHKVKAKRKVTMADVKLNPDSDDVGTKFKIIGISVALGLNAIVFIWYFFFSGLP